MPKKRMLAATLGLASVSLFLVTFAIFSTLNHDFDLFGDHISKLGAVGQVGAIYWNFVGFLIVGLALAAFGWLVGTTQGDRLLSVCLCVAGIGFAMGAIPTDFSSSKSAFSKAHHASLCVSLGGWFMGLARLLHQKSVDHYIHGWTKFTIWLTPLPLLAVGGNAVSEPVAHRLLLAIIFVWVIAVSVLLWRETASSPAAQPPSGQDG